MKLQRQFSRVEADVKYSKWVIVIPPAQIDMLGWKEGDELESTVEGNRLIIKVIINPLKKQREVTYEETDASTLLKAHHYNDL